MAYETKDNTGSLFPNKKKEKDTHPNITGNAMVDGKEYWVSIWSKRDKNGNPWHSMAFTPKDQAKSKPPAADEEIPFAPIGRGISGHAL